MTFEQFTEYAKRTAIMQGRRFTEPDDDWAITVIVEHAGERPHVIPIPAWVSNDSDAKAALGWALGMSARVTHPTKLAMIQSTWMVMTDRTKAPDQDWERPKVMPRDHPDRIERLFILVVDPEVQHAHFADIHRRKRRPPVLGPWESIKDGEARGQLADPLVQAMR